MSVSADDFLAHGRDLLEKSHEIESRSAISRSYYAVYHAARCAADKLELSDRENRSVGTHERLIGRYESHGKGLKKLARRIRDKKRGRAVADYQLNAPVSNEEAELFVKEAENLMRDLQRLGHDHQGKA